MLAGLLAGLLSMLLTVSVYASEDAFIRLPIHWMWWPALGGLVVGLGGLVFPRALGVGYDTIGALLQGSVSSRTLLGILFVKWAIWAISLGSGTSGGVLAPLLMMGGALGGLEGIFLPNEGVGFWPLVSMGAILGGTMRSPFTGVIFVLELTHDVNTLLPMLVAAVMAHGFTVLALRRSILTEKVSRRGYHLSREYAVDPLEVLFVRDVMRTNVLALRSDMPLGELAESIRTDDRRGQRLLPVVDTEGCLVGVLTQDDLRRFLEAKGTEAGAATLGPLARPNPVAAHPGEPLRAVVYRMAETGVTRMPVVEPGGSRKLLGLVSLRDLLKARVRNLEEERRRERVLPIRLTFPPRGRGSKNIGEN